MGRQIQQARCRRCTAEDAPGKRGIGHLDGCPLLVEKEERKVWDEAVRRLAPPAVVARLVARAADVGGLAAWEVADELDLPPDVVDRLHHLLISRPRST